MTPTKFYHSLASVSSRVIICGKSYMMYIQMIKKSAAFDGFMSVELTMEQKLERELERESELLIR